MSSNLFSYLTITFNTAGLDSGQHQPGGAVAQGECPAADDDPLGSRDGADVLERDRG